MSAVIAVASVFLVFQLGQPRIFMSMARDGLLPKQFAKIHPRFKTPAFSTIVTGIAVAIPTLFLNSQIVLDLCSIGTLFAFVLVCGGILELNAIDRNETAKSGNAVVRSGFKVPYINGQFVMPILFLLYSAFMRSMPDNHDLTHNWSWEKFPYFVFWAVFLVFSILTSIRKWSLIPVLGVITNLYLIAGIGHLNWLRFGVWCLVGLAVYFVYGYRNSRLANR
jgi:amino acid transporter